MDVKISPSILAANAAALGAEVEAITEAGADMIHFDVMDGHFVPNLTFGPQVLAAVKRHSPLPMDVHLMISPVDPLIDAFADAGADILTIHPEAGPHAHRTLQAIAARGITPGIALNPGTPASVVQPLLDMVGLVLVMSVNPGFGGQKFIPSQLEKLRTLRAMIDASGRDIILEVDGGVNAETARDVIAAGARALVAGTAVFKGGPSAYAENIAGLRDAGQRWT